MHILPESLVGSSRLIFLRNHAGRHRTAVRRRTLSQALVGGVSLTLSGIVQMNPWNGANATIPMAAEKAEDGRLGPAWRFRRTPCQETSDRPPAGWRATLNF